MMDPDSAYGIELPETYDTDLDQYSSTDSEEDTSSQSEIEAISAKSMERTEISRTRRRPLSRDEDHSYNPRGDTHKRRRLLSSAEVKSSRSTRAASGAQVAGKGTTTKKPASKSRKNTSRSTMDKGELKKLKNREAAARCRNRRKQLIEDLSVQTNKLESEKKSLQNELAKLKQRVIELEDELYSAQTKMSLLSPTVRNIDCPKCGGSQSLCSVGNQITDSSIWPKRKDSDSIASELVDLTSDVALDLLFNDTINQSLDLELYQSPEELASFEHDL